MSGLPAASQPESASFRGWAELGSLNAVQTRIGWARKYVDELKEATNAFMHRNADASAVDYKEDRAAGRIVASVHLPDGFPEDFGRVIGGAFHQLRAAFDNLAYQLVLANNGTPTKDTAFPILCQCPEGQFEARTNRRLTGMSRSARATIKELQPFEVWPERPKDTTLWLIHELNNIDKHRIHHLACLWLATCNATMYMKGGVAADIGGRVEHPPARGVVEHGAPLFELRWDPALMAARANQEVMVEFDLSADIALRSPERSTFLDPDRQPTEALPIAHFLDAALAYCDATVLPAFAGEFE